MGKISPIARPPYPQKRKYRRFLLCYPVQLKFSSGDAVSELRAISRNVSIGGLLLDAPSPIPEHAPVTFTMMIQGTPFVLGVELVGAGKVVRVEIRETGPGFTIAVECDRPIAQITDYLVASGG